MSCPFDLSSSSCDKQLLGGGIGLIVIGVAIGSCQSCFLTAAAALAAGGAVLGYWFSQYQTGEKVKRINGKIQLECDKVVNTVDIEDITEKKAYCRCWKSSKFPLCDGSHNAHNKETGDNLGPLIIDRKKE